MLKLPDDEFVAIELVHDDALAELAAQGITAPPPNSPDGPDDFRTTAVVDPDGNRIELVQWPAGHATGLTSADFTTSPGSDPPAG